MCGNGHGGRRGLGGEEMGALEIQSRLTGHDRWSSLVIGRYGWQVAGGWASQLCSLRCSHQSFGQKYLGKCADSFIFFIFKVDCKFPEALQGRGVFLWLGVMDLDLSDSLATCHWLVAARMQPLKPQAPCIYIGANNSPYHLGWTQFMGCEELLCCLACGTCSLSVNLAVKSRKRKKKTRRKIGKDKMRFEGHLKRGYGVCIKLRC